MVSGFFDGNSAWFANLDAALTSQTFFGIDRAGFIIHHFEYFHWADIDALFAALAFVLVNNRVKSH
jgi:hypothetical protein